MKKPQGIQTQSNEFNSPKSQAVSTPGQQKQELMFVCFGISIWTWKVRLQTAKPLFNIIHTDHGAAPDEELGSQGSLSDSVIDSLWGF